MHDAAATYRQFLMGGADRLHLSRRGAAAILAAGMLLFLGRRLWAAGHGDVPMVPHPLILALAILHALLVAAFCARWLGTRVGAIAGLVYLTSCHVLVPDSLAPVPESLLRSLTCLAITAAMGVFALGNVAGRLPLVDQRWTRCAFYGAAGVAFLLTGPAAPALIFAGCLLFFALGSDSRILRYLADPVAVGLFVLLAAARLAVPGAWPTAGPWDVLATSVAGHVAQAPLGVTGALRWLALASLPWTPFALVGAIIGLRRGHYATPIWRFCGCWTLGPLLLVATGIGIQQDNLPALLPPMAVMAAAGLTEMLAFSRRCRILRRMTRSTAALGKRVEIRFLSAKRRRLPA